MSIDEFIDIVHTRLKYKVEQVPELWPGEDLMLTGMTKDNEGNPFERGRLYSIGVPAYIIVDHRAKLRRAFLSKKKKGVKDYLASLNQLSESDLDKIMGLL